MLRRRRKRKVLATLTQCVRRACYPNHVWGYDFVFGQTEDGRTLKCLTVVDEFTRQGLAIRVARSLTAGDVIRAPAVLCREHGPPACLRSDNGPGLVSAAVQAWLKKNWQNAYTESFNSIFRSTGLDRWLFCSSTGTLSMIRRVQHRPATWIIGGYKGAVSTAWSEGNTFQQPSSQTL